MTIHKLTEADSPLHSARDERSAETDPGQDAPGDRSVERLILAVLDLDPLGEMPERTMTADDVLRAIGIPDASEEENSECCYVLTHWLGSPTLRRGQRTWRVRFMPPVVSPHEGVGEDAY